MARLQGANPAVEQEDAWADFLAAYSGTLLHVCRSVTRDGDTAMDAYAFVVDGLRADDCRRLRAYTPEANVRFTSWLAVVARRLVLDFVRQRYGRSRSSDVGHREEQQARRRLEDLIVDEIDPDDVADDHAKDADLMLRRRELLQALALVLDELSPTDRLLLALRFEDECPVREIARTLGLPSVFHVYRRLAVVLSRLRESLRAHGVDEAEA